MYVYYIYTYTLLWLHVRAFHVYIYIYTSIYIYIYIIRSYIGELNHGPSLALLGFLYLHGSVTGNVDVNVERCGGMHWVQMDIPLAKDILLRAAMLGDGDAIFALGLMAREGVGFNNGLVEDSGSTGHASDSGRCA
jgi:hypothetical protein